MGEIFYFTKKQNLIEKWVSEKGFKVKSEVDIFQYRVDLAIDEIKMAIEVDGPSHRKLKKEGDLVDLTRKHIDDRDYLLLKFFPNGVWHVPVDIDENTFKEEFQKIIERI